MRSRTPSNCLICGCEMRPASQPADPLKHQCRHYGRGLCQTCYQGVHSRGILDQFERVTYTRDELLAEFEILRRRNPKPTLRECADRLGMRPEAFKQAIARARRAGDPRAS